jgi:hypothetical protein
MDRPQPVRTCVLFVPKAKTPIFAGDPEDQPGQPFVLLSWYTIYERLSLCQAMGPSAVRIDHKAKTTGNFRDFATGERNCMHGEVVSLGKNQFLYNISPPRKLPFEASRRCTLNSSIAARAHPNPLGSSHANHRTYDIYCRRHDILCRTVGDDLYGSAGFNDGRIGPPWTLFRTRRAGAHAWRQGRQCPGKHPPGASRTISLRYSRNQ